MGALWLMTQPFEEPTVEPLAILALYGAVEGAWSELGLMP
jgi:hypothetical protein